MNLSCLRLRKVIRYRAFGIFAVLVGLLLVFYFVTPEKRFFDPRAIRTILTRASEYGIIAIGITFLMISRELDISVGSVFTLCSLLFAFLYLKLGWDPIFALLCTLAVGAMMGSLNGLVSLKFGIPSIITTLGTMYLWRGAALVAGRGQPIYYRGANPFGFIFTARLGGFLPMGFVWFIVLTIFFEIILHYHRFGNRVRASGGNTKAAREMGINTDRTKLICFSGTACRICFNHRIYPNWGRIWQVGDRIRVLRYCRNGNRGNFSFWWYRYRNWDFPWGNNSRNDKNRPRRNGCIGMVVQRFHRYNYNRGYGPQCFHYEKSQEIA